MVDGEFFQDHLNYISLNHMKTPFSVINRITKLKIKNMWMNGTLKEQRRDLQTSNGLRVAMIFIIIIILYIF